MIEGYSSGDYLSIIVLIGIMLVLVVILKWINGDFSPVSIEEISRRNVEEKNSNGDVIKNSVIVEYKKTYHDGRVKISYKKM